MPHLISFLSGLSRRLLSRTKTFSSCEKYRQLSFEYGGPGGGLRPHGTTVGKRWVEDRSFTISLGGRMFFFTRVPRVFTMWTRSK